MALLFYVAGGIVRGAVGLQKVILLPQSELGLGGFKFTTSRYGPWFKELEDLVHELAERGWSLRSISSTSSKSSRRRCTRGAEVDVRQGVRELTKAYVR